MIAGYCETAALGGTLTAPIPGNCDLRGDCRFRLAVFGASHGFVIIEPALAPKRNAVKHLEAANDGICVP